MITQSDNVLTFPAINHAHDTDIIKSTKNLNRTFAVYANTPLQDVYQAEELTDNKVLATHFFPEFDAIRARFQDTMGVIIITVEENDLIEVAINAILKNGPPIDIETLNNPIIQANITEGLKQNYAQVTGRLRIAKTTEYQAKPTNNSLLLKYSELFNESETGYLTLDKLSQFTGLAVTDNIVQSFRNYAQGRQKLLTYYKIWLSN
jgi:hypothetical protein